MQKPEFSTSVEAIAFHREHPRVSIVSYVKAQALELGASIREIGKVYLDKRFWVLLRDAHMGRSKQLATAQLLSEIRAGMRGKA